VFGKKREERQEARIALLETQVDRLLDRVSLLEIACLPKPKATRAKK
jgi:hypothetical protein